MNMSKYNKRYNKSIMNTRKMKKLKEIGIMKINQKLGRTFLSKLIISLTSKIFIPSFHLQILRYETFNRSKEEILKAMPWLKTGGCFENYINLKEADGKINNLQILYDIASESFYKYKKAMSFLKKPNEKKNYFYLILNGEISRLNLVFIKRKVSIENYLFYLMKMNLLKEDYIIQKCTQLNKNTINIHIGNIDTFTKNGIIYDLNNISNKAKEELIKEGVNFSDKNKKPISSVEQLISLSDIPITQNRFIYSGYELYFGCYSKNGELKKGDFIGDLSRNEVNENFTYICKTDCDIVVLDKNYTKILSFKMHDYIESKLKYIFMQLKRNNYIFKDISDDYCLNNILPILIYKTYKKGEKIFSQFSTYEGIFLIIKGKIKLSLSQSYKELSNTLANLTYATSHFRDYASQALNNFDLVNEFHLGHIIKKKSAVKLSIEETDFLSSNKYNESFNGIYDVQFYILEDGESLGFNELFNNETGLYNFSAECMTDEATLFFIPKNIFKSLYEKKNEILERVIQLVELRAKSLIGQITSFKNRLKRSVLYSFKTQRAHKIINNNINNSNSTKNISSSNLNFDSSNNVFNKINNNNISNISNISLFKNNNLFQYFKNSKFFDYSNALSNKNKLNFKNLYETEKNSNKNELTKGRTFQGFNKNFSYSKISKMKIEKNINNINKKDLNLNFNYTIYDFKKKHLYNNTSNLKESYYINANKKNILKRNSSLPILTNKYKYSDKIKFDI